MANRRKLAKKAKLEKLKTFKDNYLASKSNVESSASESFSGESFYSGCYETFHGENDEDNDEMDVKVKRTVSVSPHYHSKYMETNLYSSKRFFVLSFCFPSFLYRILFVAIPFFSWIPVRRFESVWALRGGMWGKYEYINISILL